MLMLPPSTLPVAITVPLADTEAALTAALVIKLPPVMLPVATTVPLVDIEAALTAPAVTMLPPVILPTATTVVAAVKLELKFNADTTFELRLNPAAFKLLPVMLPATDANPGVVIFPPAMFPVTSSELRTLPLRLRPDAFKLPPVTLPLALTDAAETAAAVTKLPPVTLPVALISPVTYSPVVANTATLAVPPTPTVTLPPELTIVTLLVPLLMLATDVITPVSNAPLPKIYPPVMLPAVDIGFVPNAAKLAATLALP